MFFLNIASVSKSQLDSKDIPVDTLTQNEANMSTPEN